MPHPSEYRVARACWKPRTGRRRVLFPLVALFLALGAEAATNVLKFTYDPAGNITRIERETAPGFAITGVSPTSGLVGASVTIYGTGFSATAADNAVAFNGIAAAVLASDAGSISTAVPTGATTGRITVTVIRLRRERPRHPDRACG